jgi:integrase
MILRVHLVPALGHKRLDAIKSEDVQHLKGRLSTKAAKTDNNILTVLNVMLKKAVDWDEIDRMPCAITLLPVPKTSMSFYDFDEYERLVAATSSVDATTHLIVLLGGEAGLRCGEMIALEWRDVDLGKRQICVQRSDWNGQVTTPKGGRLRYVPLGHTINMGVALYEGATLITDWLEYDISDTFTIFPFTLDVSDQAAITDWDNLFLEITRGGDTGGATSTWRRIEIDRIWVP